MDAGPRIIIEQCDTICVRLMAEMWPAILHTLFHGRVDTRPADTTERVARSAWEALRGGGDGSVGTTRKAPCSPCRLTW